MGRTCDEQTDHRGCQGGLMAIFLLYLFISFLFNCEKMFDNRQKARYKVFDVEDDLYFNGVYHAGDEFL